MPNIVYILADEHRHDVLGCAGNEVVSTPNLDRMAREGVRFKNTWCQSPICQPSRASIITGRYPHELGIVQNFRSDFNPAWPTMMKDLQGAGYLTANVGKTHYYQSHETVDHGFVDTSDFAPMVASYGFDSVLEEFDRHIHVNSRIESPYKAFLRDAGRLDDYVAAIESVFPFTEHHWDGIVSPLPTELEHASFLTDRALDWLDHRNGARPFFLQLSYVQPHSPLMGPAEWADRYSDADVPLGTSAPATGNVALWERHLSMLRARSQPQRLTADYLRRGIRQYYANVSLVDSCVGRVMDALLRQGVLEDTWVIYSSDHGQMLGDHGLMAKGNFYASSVRVPAIVRPPRTTAACGSVESCLTESVDLTATVLDVAGVAPSSEMRGRSLAPRVMTGEHPNPRDVAFSEIGAANDAEVLFQSVTDGARRITIERGTSTLCEVFDLEDDPDECVNLNLSPEGRRIAGELVDRLGEIVEPVA